MQFNSLDFMVFFPITVLGYYVIPHKIRYIWLLLCSYYFYMCWNFKYVLLILTSTLVTYFGSRIISYAKRNNRLEPSSVMKQFSVQCTLASRLNTLIEKHYKTSFRSMEKVVLVSVIAVNLGILAFFKYFNFFTACFVSTMRTVGVNLNVPKVDVLLPVGISFYTFQALSYTIDIYRGELEPEKNILKYALFVSFFPQLVAGPIERSKNLLTQIQLMENLRFNLKRANRGLLFILWGLFLKMVISDRIAILVNTVFDKFYLYGGIELIAAAIGFAIQIYCDFSSYSTIAIGAAEVLGFTLMENFDAPYFSGSIQEFWRRWHISLSTWFRDYLYIPLGGNRCSKVRRYLNLMSTFLLSGLWHGAALTFIVWGGIHGFYQIVGDVLRPVREEIIRKFEIKTDCFSFRLGRIIWTFLLTDLAWIFFRAENLHIALSYVKRIIVDFDPWALTNGSLFTLGLDRVEMNIFFFGLLLLFLVDMLKYYKKISFPDFIIQQNTVFQYVCAAVMLMSVLIYGAYGPSFIPQTFIYFQF